MCVLLLDIGLQRGYLSVYVGNVLFDDKCQFLKDLRQRTADTSVKNHTLISTGLSSNSVFRFATASWSISAVGQCNFALTLCKLS